MIGRSSEVRRPAGYCSFTKTFVTGGTKKQEEKHGRSVRSPRISRKVVIALSFSFENSDVGCIVRRVLMDLGSHNLLKFSRCAQGLPFSNESRVM